MGRTRNYFATMIVAAAVSGFMIYHNRIAMPVPIHPLARAMDNANEVYKNKEAESVTMGVTKGMSEEHKHRTKPKSEGETHLAVIFTTLKNSSGKLFIYNNTIKNWSYFKNKLKPVLFTIPNQGPVLDIAKSHGWDTIPCPRENQYGTPYLKDMYFEVYKRYKATFYGFCNGDILFDDGLAQTLEGVKDTMDDLNMNTTMVVSRRWNHNIKNASFYDNDPIWLPQKVRSIAKKGVSSLYRTDAEDFFFVNKNYPWDGIKDVVIGRPGYDNYMVARSIQMSVSTVEGTQTIAAVHQTGTDGNLAGSRNKDGNFNKRIIGKFNYYAGLSDRSWFSTRRDFRNRVYLVPLRWKGWPANTTKAPADQTDVHGQEINNVHPGISSFNHTP